MQRIDISEIPKYSDEPRGHTNKYWINKNGLKLVKYNETLYPDQDIMEKLSSEILKRLSLNTVNVELGFNSSNDCNCCIIDSFLCDGEVSYSINQNWIKLAPNNSKLNISICIYRVFKIFENLHNIDNQELENIKSDYIRMIFADCIIGNEDRKLKNVDLIFNEKTMKYRLAPIFDNAVAFHAYSLSSDDTVAYVGNELFFTDDILDFLIMYYYNEIKDIISKLRELDIELLLNQYDEISNEKKIYIINHINKTRNKIDELERKKQSENKRY